METDWKKKYEDAMARMELCERTGLEKKSDYIFPELAESEDEKIREALIGHCKDLVRMNQDNKGMLSIYEPWIAYLEKQKEQDKCPEYCVRSHCIGCSIYEKQKEQKHNEDDFTIYHPLKNGKGKYECIPYSFYGSLTSFSEDKDLIDFLRTCFYTEEECNEWIEQQKEQKQQLPLMGGDTDTYFDDLRMTTKPLTSREWFNEGIKYAQRLQKEQKPAIKLVFPRFRVGDIIRNVHDKWDKTTKRISYVGEHGYCFDYKHLRGNAGGGSFGFCYEDYYELVEQKPAEWSEEDEVYLQDALWCVKQAAKVASDMGACWSAERWLKSLRPSWKPSEEQMMDEWLKDRDGCFWDGVEEGKKTMEKQIMEGAVDAEIVKDIHNLLHVKSDILPMPTKHKLGDKVKIIILKDDEN
jgi:hypothetical protein